MAGMLSTNSLRRLLQIASLTLLGCAETAPMPEADPDPVPIAVVNRSGAAIECRAALAHWRSAELGRAERDGTVEATLWIEASSGTVFLGDPPGTPVPVEMLWCGAEGRSWTTRANLPLPRGARRGDRIVWTCVAAEGGRLFCR